MPDLAQSLHGYDLGQLYIIAELWGLELDAPNLRQGRMNLAAALLERSLVEEVCESLPPEAQLALADLQQHQRRLPWALFTRRYGQVREMGPGKRDREKPHLNPLSTAEILWYRALVARAFFDTPEGPQEFVYVPADLAALLPALQSAQDVHLSRPATPEERADQRPANDFILDQACTLLAALRLGLAGEELQTIVADWPLPLAVLKSLLLAAGLLDAAGRPVAEQVRSFLEAERGPALLKLVTGWLNSQEHNDLRLMAHLKAEGEWSNDPLLTRQNILALLQRLDEKTWWSLPAFVATVKSHRPDFQRPAGDYDSWYLKDQRSGEYLRGFEHWEVVDGELLRYLVSGPLHWLGLVDLAAPRKDAPPLAFRFSRWAAALLEGQVPAGLALENQPLSVDSKLQVNIPRLAPRAARYLVARFCEWQPQKKDEYRYRITPAALKRAEEQGLQVKQLLALLRRHTASELPPNLVQALKRWQQHGTQVRLQRALVLRVSHPKILAALRDSRAARFLEEPLGPTSIMVKPGAWQQVLEALSEMGYLGEMRED